MGTRGGSKGAVGDDLQQQGDAAAKKRESSLNDDLYGMRPRPFRTYHLEVWNPDTGWRSRGYACHFQHPSKKAEQAVLEVARSWRQPAVWKWHAHRWGLDPTQHSQMMESIVAARVRLRPMHKSVPVYPVPPVAFP